MADTRSAPTRAVSVRLSPDEDSRLARLLEHFSGDTPAGFRTFTPSDILRVALNRLWETELGGKKKPGK